MTRDLDFWQNARGEKETRVRAIAKQFETLAGDEITDYWEPVRLAYWFDTHLSEPMPESAEELANLIDRESELFSGDYDSLATAAEDLAQLYWEIDEEATRHLVIDWRGTWDYSFQYDFDSCDYVLAEEPADGDFVQLPKFIGGGVWVWRNN